jgi:glycosyltransferase involved in cell wall biosynthesis
MADGPVTVAIPVRNSGPLLADVLAAVRGQRLDREVELLVADSGSTDGSDDLARSFGAAVFTVERFSHGGTRNELMERSHGAHVAFLTQDAVPADDRWLARLLSGFDLAPDVGLACGPYRARPGAPVAVARELAMWFAALAPDGTPRVDRTADPRGPGPVTFFTDANGAVARAAWSSVPYRAVPYAEDHALAVDMLRAGYAKAFVPDAAVVHSHDYGPLEQFRRTFDEWRGLREVYGFVQPLAPAATLLKIQSEVRADLRETGGRAPGERAREAARSARHWTVRAAGAALGSRADRLPSAVRAWSSLERRQDFAPSASPR